MAVEFFGNLVLIISFDTVVCERYMKPGLRRQVFSLMRPASDRRGGWLCWSDYGSRTSRADLGAGLEDQLRGLVAAAGAAYFMFGHSLRRVG